MDTIAIIAAKITIISIEIKNKNLNQTKIFGFEPALTPQLKIKNKKPNSQIILEKQGPYILIKNS